MNALHSDFDSDEVRLRVAAKCATESDAGTIGREVQTLYNNGPAGGGARMNTREVIGIVSTLIDRSAVDPTVEYRKVSE